MATRVIVGLSILTDYTQSEEDLLAATLAGASAGSSIIFNTDIAPAPGLARIWNGTSFENAPALLPVAVPLATSSSQGAIPAFGSALQVMRVNAGTTALEFVGLVKGDVGLGNVDNTSDANKVVSNATQTALDLKVDENTAITGATKTKITYDAKGLITSGADATTVDIADSANKRYVTDAQQTVIGNTSGTNTGDNATNTQYSGLAASKQDTLVSGTNIKTINGSSVLGSGDLVISGSGLTQAQSLNLSTLRL